MGNKLETEGDKKFAEENYSEAIDYYTCAIQGIKENTNIQKQARILNKLGDCYAELNDHKESIRSYEKALHLQESKLGENHISTATTFNCLGIAYYKEKKYDLALDYLTKSLYVQSKNLSEHNKEVAANYYNIAQLFRDVGDFEKSLSYYKKALEINIKFKSPHDPVIALNHHGIGILYTETKEYELAESHLKQSLAIREKAFGKGHAEVAKTLTALGILASSKKDVDQACEYHLQALEIRVASLGSENIDTVRSKQYVARCLYLQGHDEESLRLVNEAMQFYEVYEGNCANEKFDAFKLLGELYDKMGDEFESEKAKKSANDMLRDCEIKQTQIFMNPKVIKFSNPKLRQQISLRP